MSANNFYIYMLMNRSANPNLLLQCRDLFHHDQFLVDVFAKVESERLLFFELRNTCIYEMLLLMMGMLGIWDSWLFYQPLTQKALGTCIKKLRMP